MSVYNPDRWKMVKITNNKGNSHYRVFAIWYGSYTSGESWKLNSGVTKAIFNEKNNSYEFHGSSGSVYVCHRNGYGTSGYGMGVLKNLKENSTDLVIEELEETENFLELPYN